MPHQGQVHAGAQLAATETLRLGPGAAGNEAAEEDDDVEDNDDAENNDYAEIMTDIDTIPALSGLPLHAGHRPSALLHPRAAGRGQGGAGAGPRPLPLHRRQAGGLARPPRLLQVPDACIVVKHTLK